MGAASPRLVAFRCELQRRRAAGEPFEDAWREALRGLPHGYEGDTLRKVLPSVRASWERAYDGEPPEPRDLAAAQLVHLLTDEAGGRADTVLVA